MTDFQIKVATGFIFMISLMSSFILPGLMNLTVLPNSGISLGVGAGEFELLILGLSMIVLAIIGRELWSVRSRLPWVFIFLIGAGAANTLERLIFGEVRDWIPLSFILFNVADLFIVCGLLVYLWTSVRRRKFRNI